MISFSLIYFGLILFVFLSDSGGNLVDWPLDARPQIYLAEQEVISVPAREGCSLAINIRQVDWINQ